MFYFSSHDHAQHKSNLFQRILQKKRKNKSKLSEKFTHVIIVSDLMILQKQEDPKN